MVRLIAVFWHLLRSGDNFSDSIRHYFVPLQDVFPQISFKAKTSQYPSILHEIIISEGRIFPEMPNLISVSSQLSQFLEKLSQ
jgi:hypothetical protein